MADWGDVHVRDSAVSRVLYSALGVLHEVLVERA